MRTVDTPKGPVEVRHEKAAPAPFTLESFAPLLAGNMEPPNLQELEPRDALNNLAAYGTDATRGQFIGAGLRAFWALWDFSRTQGGAYSGAGSVIVYSQGGGRAFRFSLCDHVMQEGAGANHSRGWHPGHCVKCGLDMSVNSGD